ncbi:hypothetical protein CEE37_11790 [candidate division LCP-89 bacterium B3_LCP]|uniref:MalT-like TPR region domain-containing protein n=1 Tax=candidate division LCP-89 bacterium B3_LCP TaxID=2012998 RepID=A0A532UVY5_UNCL8|nr:MAG: hypothetical protein CEE37_11790 [candidate division LCP-89 bacterium B3_LCP]
MVIESLVLFSAIKKFSDVVGLTADIQRSPEKTLDAIYEKVVQDNPRFLQYWNRIFQGDLKRIFDRTFEAIAPGNESVKRKFILATGSDPGLNQICIDIERGFLPKVEQLVPIFENVLPGENPHQVAEKFIRLLYKSINLDKQQAFLLDSSHLKELDEVISNTEKILERIVKPLDAGTRIIVEEGKPHSDEVLVSAAKLPMTDATLLGREKELKMLDNAWENENCNVISLVAFGGVGKTALVNVWLNNIAQDHYRGAQKVYGYSFYTQGTSEDKQASADPFITAALEWFGDPDPTEGSPWQKGERLAKLVREERTLLILDGLEPIQYPPGEMGGRLRDPGMQSLLRGLGSHNPGLCVITTRLEVEDLKRFKGSLAEYIDLEKLTPEAGAKLLELRGAKGSEKELKKASEEFEGHALALNLLGNYLSVVYDGDIRKRDQIPKLTKYPQQGGYARRVMESYQRMFKDKPELDVLYMVGLFDRPAEGGAIEALKAEPVIAGLTTRIADLSHEDWQFTLHNLRTAKLLTEKIEGEPDTLDCHPLIREHFGERLKKENSATWKEAHRRLYEYYKTTAKEFPDTIEEMIPLYEAVVHGCHAELHKEVLHEVYWKRIQRGNKYFSKRQLGVYGYELSALSCFLDPQSKDVVEGLSETDEVFILSELGFSLRAQGRLVEAVQLLQLVHKSNFKQSDWINYAIQVGNISELYLIIGDIGNALVIAGNSFEASEMSSNIPQFITTQTAFANALHKAGNIKQAKILFSRAEEIQKSYQPNYPLLYSLQGFNYCDLLLSLGNYSEVINRGSQTLKWMTQQNWLLGIALDNLTLGRAYLLQILNDKRSAFSKAENHLNEAVIGLRKAGVQEYIARGLQTRAELYRVKEDFTNCLYDLEEAMEIATLGGMRLFEADCHLGYARLYMAKGEKEKAREHLCKAKEIIDDTGYHRRDEEVKNLECRI